MKRLGWSENQRDPIIAIAQIGRRWAVVKHMALVAAAARAMIFRARQNKLEISLKAEPVWDVVIKARPASAGVEFGLRSKELKPAASAGINAFAIFLIEGAGAGALSAFAAQDRELFGRQALFPFFFRQLPFVIVRNERAIGFVWPHGVFLCICAARGGYAAKEAEG